MTEQASPPSLPTAPSARPLKWWDVGVAVAVLAMLAIAFVGGLLAGDDDTVPQLSLHAGLILLYAAWYVALGRAAILRATLELATRRLDWVFLVGIVVLPGFGTAVWADYATMQVVAYPMIWTIVQRYWGAVTWSAALASAATLGLWWYYGNEGVTQPYAQASIIGVVSFAFAVAMGTWLTRMFEQSERYRRLAEELRRSQAEVAALSEASGAAAERDRLSRELHDTLTQTLTGLVMLGEQVERAVLAGDTELASERITRVNSAAREAVSEARALVATTQPIGDGGLEAAIERVAARLRADSGMRIACDIEPLALSREQQVVLLRATQEGFANARRHARASQVSLSLHPDEHHAAVLVIADDGVGPGSARSSGVEGGFGLSGLADRVRGVGGDVRFGAGAGGGATLEVSLPRTRADSEGATT